VLKDVICVEDVVDIAWTVSAAAVNTAFGSSVAGALDGRLQAVNKKIMMSNSVAIRALVDILFS
jgi:hypothetical protein